MKIEILDAAEKDLLDGYDFYECQSKGLGDKRQWGQIFTIDNPASPLFIV